MLLCDGRPELPVRGGCGPAAGGEFPDGSQEPEEAALCHREEVQRSGTRHQQGGQIPVLLPVLLPDTSHPGHLWLVLRCTPGQYFMVLFGSPFYSLILLGTSWYYLVVLFTH